MENTKNKIGVVAFVIILLIFIIGGYLAMKYFTEDHSDNNNSNKEIVDLRIDTTKDYVYYENEVELVAAEEIIRSDVILNFNTLEDLNNTLKEENNNIYQNIKYTKDMSAEVTEGLNVNDEGIYSLNYREYEDNKFGEYVSLIIKDYSYDIKDGTNIIALKSYVVDVNSGNIISNEDLLNKFAITTDTVNAKIKERLENTQTLTEEESAIDINGTMSNLAYVLSVNKNGKLMATFIVKSRQNNYNDNVELN